MNLLRERLAETIYLIKSCARSAAMRLRPRLSLFCKIELILESGSANERASNMVDRLQKRQVSCEQLADHAMSSALRK